MTTRYRMFRPSISIASILRTFDIEGCNRTSTISKLFDVEAWSFDIDAVRYRRNSEIEVQNFDIFKDPKRGSFWSVLNIVPDIIYDTLYSVPKQEQVFYVCRPLTAMKIVKWILTITVVT
jgi:hypothetical protein